MDDKRITELFFERSESAIAELSKKYGKVFFSVAYNILNNKLDAEECVNDAFLAVWNSIPPANPTVLSAYVVRIVRNIAIKRYHKNTALKRNSIYDTALDELENCILSTESVTDIVDAEELTVLINDFLKTLEKTDRIMFVRRYWYSDPIPDIARQFGVTEHYVSVKLSRIRAKLKKYLIKKGVTV